nr:hypothetical protein [Tanacetum cinerariifolium]
MSEEDQTVDVVVLPKFDMPSYESTMSAKDVKSLAIRHSIPLDLHPCALTEGWTMDQLPADMIGLYEQYFEFLGIKVPFSTLLLANIKHFRVHISQLVSLGLNRLTMFELYCRSLNIVPSVNLFRVFYKVSKQGHWFSFEKRLGKGAGGKMFQKTFSGLKGWKKRILFLYRRAIPDAMAWRHHDFDVNDPLSEDGFNALDVQALTENFIDLRLVPLGLVFKGGLATTWEFPGFHSIFKDTKGNVLTFPLFVRATIERGPTFSDRDQIAQHTTPPLLVDQPIQDKTDHQKEVEVEDHKIVATRERKARAAAKKKGDKKRDGDAGEGSRPKVKRRKVPIVQRDGSAASEHVSSLEPIWTVDHTGLAVRNPPSTGVGIAKSRKDRSLHIPPHDSANHFVHNYIEFHDDNDETNNLRLGSFVDQTGKDLNAGTTEECESSCSQALYVPNWTIPRRCRVDSLMWCRELMVHLAPPMTHEESNALSNAVALERAWFNLAQGENLQDDYDKLVEVHAEYEMPVRKLVTARVDLEHNAKLYTDMAGGYKRVKEEHEGCVNKLQVLEEERNELSHTNKDQALWIKELEAKLATTDSALVYAERISTERAEEKEKLVTQLGRTQMEKLDCVCKLLLTVVGCLFQSHEYKQSLSKPFNMAIQAGWGKGLAEGRSEKDIMDALLRV